MPGLTLLELRTRVQALGYGVDAGVVSAINVAINAAQNRVCAIRRWTFLETSTSQAIPAATSEVTLLSFPTDFDRVDAARMFDGTAELDMRWMDPEEFRKRQWLFQDEAIGPYFWTRYRERILLGPATDKPYTLTLEGVQSPTPLTADGNNTVIPQEYSEVLVYGAASWLAMRERDWAMRQVCEELFAKHLNAMLTAYAHDQRQNAGEVARWDGWNEVAGGRLVWRA